jgi:NitT/TauT family transport system ATP-binding protein
MAGLLEILAAHGGRDDLPMLARQLTFDVEDLLPLVDAAQLLGLATVDDADIELTDEGRSFVEADIDTSKAIQAGQDERAAGAGDLQQPGVDPGRHARGGLLPRPSPPRLFAR